MIMPQRPTSQMFCGSPSSVRVGNRTVAIISRLMMSMAVASRGLILSKNTDDPLAFLSRRRRLKPRHLTDGVFHTNEARTRPSWPNQGNLTRASFKSDQITGARGSR